MELVNITTGEPILREAIEAAHIAAQPATVMVYQVIVGENGPQAPQVEIDNHVDFTLPSPLTNEHLAAYGAVIVDPAERPEALPGNVVERDGVEQYEPGRWREKWITRPMTAEERKASVPASITRRQARTVLSRHGHLATVEAALAAMPGQAGEEARIDWADALEFRREYPLIETLRLLLELTEEQVDDMYIEGAAIL